MEKRNVIFAGISLVFLAIIPLPDVVKILVVIYFSSILLLSILGEKRIPKMTAWILAILSMLFFLFTLIFLRYNIGVWFASLVTLLIGNIFIIVGTSLRLWDVSDKIRVSNSIISIFGLLSRYANFKKRATRKEYWMWYLFLTIANGVSIWFFTWYGSNINIISFHFLYWIVYTVFLLIPQIAVFTRRMHDIGKSGWAWTYTLIPIAGPIIMLVLLCRDGDINPNEYGEDPKVRAESKKMGNKSKADSGKNNTNDNIILLERYGKMYKDGLLTKTEFEAKKKELL